MTVIDEMRSGDGSIVSRPPPPVIHANDTCVELDFIEFFGSLPLRQDVPMSMAIVPFYGEV